MTMTTLYLDRKGLELRLDGAALALYENGERTATVPLALLDRVVIRAETTLTSGVLGAIVEGGRAAVVLSSRHGRRMAIVHGRAHNDAALRFAQYSAVQDGAWRLAWARRMIGTKITRQIRFMEGAMESRADRHKPIFDALELLRPLRGRVMDQAFGLESLRGLEGAAQAGYFRAYFIERLLRVAHPRENTHVP